LYHPLAVLIGSVSGEDLLHLQFINSTFDNVEGQGESAGMVETRGEMVYRDLLT
jgi:hypothetical protein